MATQSFCYFQPYLGKIPILTSIFFRWVGSTTNRKRAKRRLRFPKLTPQKTNILHLRKEGSLEKGKKINPNHQFLGVPSRFQPLVFGFFSTGSLIIQSTCQVSNLPADYMISLGEFFGLFCFFDVNISWFTMEII